jgi:hypothetical protein
MAEQQIIPLRLEALSEYVRKLRDDLLPGLPDGLRGSFQTHVLIDQRAPEQVAPENRLRSLVHSLDDLLRRINAYLGRE